MEKGRITSISDFQLLQNVWEKQVIGEDDLTPKGRFDRMMEEVEEAKVEVDGLNGSEESRKRLGGEIADIIFVALGVLSTLNMDAEVELNRILQQNYEKYNPTVNRMLRAAGLTPREALSHQKSVWCHSEGAISGTIPIACSASVSTQNTSSGK